MITFDVHKLVKDMGGRSALMHGLNKNKLTQNVTLKTIDKWHERGIVPMQRFMDIFVLFSLEHNKDLSFKDYLTTRPSDQQG